MQKVSTIVSTPPRGHLRTHPRRFLEILMLQSPAFVAPGYGFGVAASKQEKEVGAGVLEGSCHRV